MRPTAEVADVFRQLLDSEPGGDSPAPHWDSSVWAKLDAAGFGAVIDPSDPPGAGTPELWAVAETAGQHGAAVPVVEVNLARFALGLLGNHASARLPAITRLRPHSVRADRAEGTVRDVSWGSVADQLVLVATGGDGTRAGVIELSGCEISEGVSVADEPSATVVLGPDGVTLQRLDARLDTLLSLAQCARILGAARSVLSLTVHYTQDRHQFGRPIGTFQAVSHQLAALGAAVELLAAMTQRLAQDAGEPAGELVACAARLRAAQTAAVAVDIGHQLHGAIGVTTEYGLQRHTRHLLAWAGELGSPQADEFVLGSAAAGAGALWQLLSSGSIAGGHREHQ